MRSHSTSNMPRVNGMLERIFGFILVSWTLNLMRATVSGLSPLEMECKSYVGTFILTWIVLVNPTLSDFTIVDSSKKACFQYSD
jgi:hypothetical protein